MSLLEHTHVPLTAVPLTKLLSLIFQPTLLHCAACCWGCDPETTSPRQPAGSRLRPGRSSVRGGLGDRTVREGVHSFVLFLLSLPCGCCSRVGLLPSTAAVARPPPRNGLTAPLLSPRAPGAVPSGPRLGFLPRTPACWC